MAETSDAVIFTDQAEAGAAFEKRSRELHEKLDRDPRWQSRRFDTLDEAIEFFKDTHPFIADSLRKQKVELAAMGCTA